MEIDFKEYIKLKKSEGFEKDLQESHSYAHRTDRTIGGVISKIRGLKYSVESLIKGYVHIELGNLLRSGVQVSPNQFPEIYNVVSQCAQQFQIPIPRIFVKYEEAFTAYTFGTNLSSYLVLTSRLIDDFSDEELHFVIGHECGHIHNNHVTYITLAHILLEGHLPMLMRIPLKGVMLPLRSWQRKAEITSDRAGLIYCKNLDVAKKALAKLLLGVYLDNDYDVESIAEQFKNLEGSHFLSKVSELFEDHPHIGRRIEALELFAHSELYYDISGLPNRPSDLLTKKELDKKVSKIVQVLK